MSSFQDLGFFSSQ